MILYVLLIIIMTLFASSASFLLKISADKGTIINIITCKYLYIGGFLYIIAALLNIWILQKMPYSAVVPLGSFNYIWTMIIAGIFLKEKIGVRKITGVLLILTGVFCIAIF